MMTGGFNEVPPSPTTERPAAPNYGGNGGNRTRAELVDDRFKLDAKLDPAQDFIGASYLGATYLAYDTHTNQNVRLLLFNEAILHYGQAVLDQLRANIEQAKTVQISDLAQVVKAQIDPPGNDGKRYIAFSYIKGETLRQRLARGPRLTQQEVGDLILKLASAVQNADDQPGICPVLLPETITLGEVVASQATLYDLGVSTLTFDHLRFVELLTPEQQSYLSSTERAGKRPTPADRVFTLAVLAYELLLSKPGGSLSVLPVVHSMENIQRVLQSANSTVANVLRQALAPNSSYATPRDFARALEGAFALPTTRGQQPAAGTAPLAVAVVASTPVVYCVNHTTGEEQTVLFTGEFLAIGHDPDANQLILQPARGIAARHACFWRTAAGLITLADIDDPVLGRNRQPTLLNNVRLSPYIAAVVDEQSSVQIGNYQISFQTSTATIKMASAGKIATLEVGQTHVKAKAGETLMLPLLLRYHSGKVEELGTWVEGYPNTWQVIDPGKRRFQEQGEKQLTLQITLPALAQSVAKTHELILRVVSHNLRAQVAAYILNVTLLPEHTFVCWLEPETIRLYSDANLFISNQGNLSQTFLIRYADKEGALRFEPAETRLLVRAGATGLFTFRSLPRFWHLWGRERQHAITVTVVPDLGGLPQTKAGQIISHALIPGWVLPLVGILLALVLLLLITVFKPGFTARSVEAADQSQANVIITPMAGVPFTLRWSGINDCFYSVYVDDVAKAWLVPTWQRESDDITHPITPSLAAGSNVEVQMRNCLFISGQPWRIQVGTAPTPTPPALPMPTIKTFIASYAQVLVGQTGDLCFGWQVSGDVTTLKIEPQVGVLNPTDEQKCVPSTTLFTQPGYFTFTLTAANAGGAAPPRLWPVEALAPECDVKYSELYLREGPDVTFDPPRVILGQMRSVTVVTRPFYPIDQPGRGWIQVLPDPGDPRPGWVDLASLDCNRISPLINGLPVPVIPAYPTPTPTFTATPTPTPTPSATPLPGPLITVNVEPKAINAGGCVLVSWEIQNVLEIYLNGVGQVGSGEIEDCPTETKTYDWHIKVKENEFVDKSLKVIVNPGTGGAPTPPVQ